MPLSYVKVAYSELGSGEQTATIAIGEGDWEITSLAVAMGTNPVMAGYSEHGTGTVAFEVLEGPDVKEIHHLLVGHCCGTFPIIMTGYKRIAGPGRLKSTIVHSDSSIHSLKAAYRRVRD